MRRLVERAGIHDLHSHDLRHEAISRLFEMGLTIPEAASVSGHGITSMRARYAHPDPFKVRKRCLDDLLAQKLLSEYMATLSAKEMT